MSFASTGIILRTIDYGESDRILSLFTKERGKISAFVPGARKSKKRSAQALDLFCKIEGVFHSRRRSSNLLRLGEFHYLDMAIGIRRDLPHIIAGAIFLESLQKLTAEMDAQPELFQLLDDFLGRLQKSDLPRHSIELPVALFRLQTLLGFLPEPTHCVRCEKPVLDPKGNGNASKTTFAFTPLEGGLVCACCSPHSKDVGIDPGALRALTQSIRGRIPAERIRLNQKIALNLHENALDMVEFLAGSALKSRHLFPLYVHEERKSA